MRAILSKIIFNIMFDVDSKFRDTLTPNFFSESPFFVEQKVAN